MTEKERRQRDGQGTGRHAVMVSEVSDFDEWVELAREVEPLFGSMADDAGFRGALLSALTNDEALCVYGVDGRVQGGVILNLAQNGIAWLAVGADSRGKGVGRSLLAAAVAGLNPNREILVQTFAPQVPEGAAARRLYMDFGFADREPGGPNPAGVPTVFMARPAGA